MPTLSFTPSQGSANRRGQRGRPGRHGSASFGQSTYNLISQPLHHGGRRHRPLYNTPGRIGRKGRSVGRARVLARLGNRWVQRLREAESCEQLKGCPRDRSCALYAAAISQHISSTRVGRVCVRRHEGRTSFRLSGPGIFGHRPALPGHHSADGRENAKNRPLAGQSGLVIGTHTVVPRAHPETRDNRLQSAHSGKSLVFIIATKGMYWFKIWSNTRGL
jgi:hypothetical protein